MIRTRWLNKDRTTLVVYVQDYRCLVSATFPVGTLPWDYVKPLAIRVSHWEEKDGIDLLGHARWTALTTDPLSDDMLLLFLPRFSPRAARRFGLVRRGQ